MKQNKEKHPININEPGDEIAIETIERFTNFGHYNNEFYLLFPDPVGIVPSRYSHIQDVLGHFNGDFDVMVNHTKEITWVGPEGSFSDWEPEPVTEVEIGRKALMDYARQYAKVEVVKSMLRDERDMLQEKSQAIYSALPWMECNLSSLFVLKVNGQSVGIVVDQDGEHQHQVILDVSDWSGSNE